VRNDREYYRAENGEGTLTLRNANYYEFSRHHKLEFGLEVWRRAADYRYAVAEDTNRLGELDPALDVRTGFQSADGAIFASYLWSPVRGFTATFGARGDYASSSKKIHGSPRIAASWRVQDRLSLNAAAGLYRQRLPLYLLHQEPGNRKLDDPQARHYIVGLDWIPKPGAQLTLEAYDKEYRHLPLEPGDPSLSVIDEGRSFSGYRRYYGLRDAGVARSRGVELQMQQKLVDRFYGLLSASVSRFRYRDYEGRWRDRACDNRYQATLVAGYKPGHRWEASLRWNFAGGVPYTPFDEARSKAMNTGIIDPTRIQEARYPSYQSLNLRLDRRFFFRKSSLVTYLSVWNTFNRKNVAAYYWNEAKNEPDTLYQWSLLPVFGVEYEF
jgi:hypothetical protein